MFQNPGPGTSHVLSWLNCWYSELSQLIKTKKEKEMIEISILFDSLRRSK